jgi:glutaredoxin
MAKSWLNNKNVVYEEINIDEPEIREKFMKDYPDLRSMPQIFIDNKNIGGYRELIKLDESILK